MQSLIDHFREGELRGRFGSEYHKLSPEERRLLAEDVDGIVANGDAQTFIGAARILSRRIGGSKALAGYVACLVAGAKRAEVRPDRPSFPKHVQAQHGTKHPDSI